jgi:hypothetical protein
VANVLSAEKRLRVLVALVEGNSEIAIERMTGVNARTVSRLARRLGEGAARLHNRLVRDLSCALIEMDEVWSYVGKKQARVTEKDGPDVGDAYTFVALDQTSRLVIAYHVGKRDQENTDAFIADLRSRLLVMPALFSDGFPAYPWAVAASFGRSVDYAQLHKIFRAEGARDDDYRTEQPSEAPTAKPLRLRTPKGTARELPGGRGFLRVVPGGKSPSPAPTPEATPVPVAPAMAPPTAQADDRQLSLLDWRPHPAKPSPPKGTQLSLFDKPEE